MSDKISELWRNIFGEAWDSLTESVPGLGGFLLVRSQSRFKAEKNALMFLGLSVKADYSQVEFAVDEGRRNGVGSSAVLKMIVDDEEVSAGFICYEMHGQKYNDAKLFTKLLDENLFIYHFQPIVNAHTGEITAYEALMRTDSSIGLNPLQVLEFAKGFDRLYDIEKATFSNTLKSLKQNLHIFENRHLFINSITGYLLTDEDYKVIHNEYSDVLNRVVVELTEQTQIPDDILGCLKERMREDKMQLAVDDYGTGYSNTSNLLRYNPCVVKIDRSLISCIDNNQKMQKMVASIVEYLHTSGYMALAEGVETFHELKCVIELGVDLLQGFYLAKPSPVLLESLKEDVIGEIQTINMEMTSAVQRVYQPVSDEEIDVRRLVSEKYTDIIIGVPRVAFVGDKEHAVSLNIRIKDNTDCVLAMKDTCIASTNAEPVLAIGENCAVTLSCEGHNRFERKGIQVPKTSSIKITGDGDLSVYSEAKKCFGIGNDMDHSHGNIIIDMTGKLHVSVNGEDCVGIGSGKNRGGNLIQIKGGNLELLCAGGTCVGIGTLEGPTRISFEEGSCRVKLTSANSVAIGAAGGEADIYVGGCVLDVKATGNCQTGVGVIKEGAGKVRLHAMHMSTELRGVSLTCIGTDSGNISCDVDNSKFVLYCEGGKTCGIGDMDGKGDVSISDSYIDVTFCTGNGKDLGSRDGELAVRNTICNTKINP